MNLSKQDWLETARNVLDTEIQGLQSVRDSLDDSYCAVLSEMASCSGRIVITGIGKSGLIGRKIAATLSSTGSPSFFLHPVEGAHGDMGMITKDDLILAISNSGETQEINCIIPSFRALGVKIVSMTSNPDSTMGRLSDLVIKISVPREACTLGLAPTASTTAALAVGDSLAVCLMRSKDFEHKDFKRFHPGGFLGRRLSRNIMELMHTDNLPLANECETIKQALDTLNSGGFGVVFIKNQHELLTGIITDGDVRRMVCSNQFRPDDLVSSHMKPDPLKVYPDCAAAAVLDIMEENAVTVLPIVDRVNRIQGLIHLHDLLGKGRYKFSDHDPEK